MDIRISKGLRWFKLATIGIAGITTAKILASFLRSDSANLIVQAIVNGIALSVILGVVAFSLGWVTAKGESSAIKSDISGKQCQPIQKIETKPIAFRHFAIGLLVIMTAAGIYWFILPQERSATRDGNVIDTMSKGADNTVVARAIASTPKLAHLDKTLSAEVWNTRVASIDEQLRSDPEFSRLSVSNRFAKIVEIYEIRYGPIMIPKERSIDPSVETVDSSVINIEENIRLCLVAANSPAYRGAWLKPFQFSPEYAPENTDKLCFTLGSNSNRCLKGVTQLADGRLWIPVWRASKYMDGGETWYRHESALCEVSIGHKRVRFEHSPNVQTGRCSAVHSARPPESLKNSILNLIKAETAQQACRSES